MQRSLSFSKELPGASAASKYRLPSTPNQPSSLKKQKPKPSKPQLPQNWVEFVDGATLQTYSKEEVKRQEVCL